MNLGIKLLIFFIVIISLYCIYRFKIYLNREAFQCQRAKEFQVVFHTFDWQPKLNGITLLNYVNEDYLNKMVINVLNNIWEPVGISWNLLQVIHEDIYKNIETYYDLEPNNVPTTPVLNTTPILPQSGTPRTPRTPRTPPVDTALMVKTPRTPPVTTPRTPPEIPQLTTTPVDTGPMVISPPIIPKSAPYTAIFGTLHMSGLPEIERQGKSIYPDSTDTNFVVFYMYDPTPSPLRYIKMVGGNIHNLQLSNPLSRYKPNDYTTTENLTPQQVLNAWNNGSVGSYDIISINSSIPTVTLSVRLEKAGSFFAKGFAQLMGKDTETFTSSSPTYPSINNQKIDDFTKIDVLLLETLIKYENLFDLPDKRNLLRNLLVQCTDDSKYDDDYIHIYLMPYLGNKKICVVEGLNGKPLIFLSLYQLKENKIKKNILTLDTTKLESKWLIKYLNNSKQYSKHSQALDELINGNQEEKVKLEKKYKQLKEELSKIGLKYPELQQTIKAYNCAQQQLIDLYSKDYLKHPDIISLRKHKKQSNYKTLVEDKINELHAIDNLKIKKLTQESKKHREVINSHQSEIDPIMENLDSIETSLLAFYSHKVNAKQIKTYTKKVDLFKKEIQQVSYFINRIGTATAISQCMAEICGVNYSNSNPNQLQNNTEFDTNHLTNNIKEGGIIFSNGDISILKDNIKNKMYHQMPHSPNKSFISKTNFAITSNNKCSILNNSQPVKIGDKVYHNIKSICEESVIYNNGIIPFLSIPERIAMIQNILSNKHQYDYIDESDVAYLIKILNELQKQLSPTSTEPTIQAQMSGTGDTATLEYIRNTIYSKEEALNIINQIINQTEIKLEEPLPTNDILHQHKTRLHNLPNSNTSSLAPQLQKILPVPRYKRQIINEAIECPTNKRESLIENDRRTLDDYLNKEVCQNYIQSFGESYL